MTKALVHTRFRIWMGVGNSDYPIAMLTILVLEAREMAQEVWELEH